MCTEALGLIVCCDCEKSVGPRAVLHGFRDSFGDRSTRLKLFFGGDDSSSWRPRQKNTFLTLFNYYDDDDYYYYYYYY